MGLTQNKSNCLSSVREILISQAADVHIMLPAILINHIEVSTKCFLFFRVEDYVVAVPSFAILVKLFKTVMVPNTHYSFRDMVALKANSPVFLIFNFSLCKSNTGMCDNCAYEVQLEEVDVTRMTLFFTILPIF